MSYSLDGTSCDCYEGTACLINKYNIKDEQKLSLLEAGITFAKTAELLKQQPPKNPDFEYYKSIHYVLFNDLYDWAGKLRTIDISKRGTAFCKAENLQEQCNVLFNYLAQNDYFTNENRSDFAEKITDFYISTNMLHPFREGNGRTQRVFITQLIKNAGYGFSFSDIDTDELMIATIQSANGVKDYLRKIFEENIYAIKK